MNFNYSISKTTPTAVISLEGNLLSKDSSELLLNDVDRLAENGHANFIFDCTQLKLMNSTGLNVLIQALTHARRAGGEVVIACVPSKVRELLLLTRLNAVFHVFETVEEAEMHLAN
jgi:anti-sigma B factor antagonist